MVENFELIAGFLDGIKPLERITVDEWADKYRYLSGTSSSEPGLYRTSRTPYLREIMQRLSSSDVAQEVVFMKGAQVGATEAGFNWLGYIMDIDPGPTLIVAPTDAMCKRNSKMRLDPMIEATPRLKGKISDPRSRDGTNTTLQKDFPGGTVVLTGANSAVGLRSMPVAKLFLDETDGYPLNLDGEGSPIDLARARTRTFPRRKIFLVSTPTVAGSSAIEKEFADTDQRFFHVPCPHCGGMQKLEFDRLRWEPGKHETARYICAHCAEPIEERNKTRMFENGCWIAESPEKITPRKYGYHINSLYSPFGWYSWADAAREYEDAGTDDEKLKVFTNTVLGLPWQEKGEVPEYQVLYNRRETYAQNKPPVGCVFLTAGVDVQKDRLEVEIVGWGRGKRTWSVDYRVLIGDTSGKEVWNDLAKIVGETWEREDGALMPLARMCVDSGYNTTSVYDFCQRFDPTRVVPTKGMANQPVLVSTPRAVNRMRNGKPAGSLGLYTIGVGIAKSELYGWLRQNKTESGGAPEGYCFFPQYSESYFKGLTAETMQKRTVKGFVVWEWHKTYERNEPLDCRVYARVAAALVGIDRWSAAHFDAYESAYRSKPKEQPQQQRRKSNFW